MMGDYNADPNPDTSKIRQIAFGFGFFTTRDTKTDQFSTASDLKVYSLVKKIGSNRLKILVDPAEIPGI